jgi:hypothetical protein
MQPSENSTINDNSKARTEILGVAILLLIAACFFYPMLFDGKVIFYRDYNLITYPFRYFLGQTFSQGAIPYWVPHANGGLPFMAAFHPGVFYPPSVLFLLNDTTYALNLFYVFHFMILGTSLYLLARCWGLSFVAALCCATTGMLSGFMVASTLLSNFFMSAVWLPVIFWLFHQYWVRKHIGYFIGLIAAIATQTLAACPEINIMTMLLLYAHSLYFLPRPPGISGVVRLTAPLGLAVALALGVCAFQLLPTAKLIKHSFRHSGLDYATHTQWSLDTKKLSTLVLSPDFRGFFNYRLEQDFIKKSKLKTQPESQADLTGNSPVANESRPPLVSGFLHTVYMGLLGLTFVLLGFFFRREKAVGFWLVVFLFGIFLAFGKHNPFYPIVYYGTPFLDLFRYPEKYVYISSFAAVFLTGYGLEALIRHTRDRQIKIFWVLTILILLFGIIGLLAIGQPYFTPEYSLAILLLFGFSYIMFYFRKMKATWFAVSVLLMIMVDLSIKDAQLLPLIDKKYYQEDPMVMDILEDSLGKHRVYSGRLQKKPNDLSYPEGPTRLASIIASKELLYPYMGMVYGVEHVNGFNGLALELENNMLWWAVFVKSPPERRRRILTRSNVKYWIDGDMLTPYSKDYPVIMPDRVKVLNEALPRAFLVPNMRLAKESEHMLNVYYDESFDPLKEVLLYGDEKLNFEKSKHFSGKVEQVVYKPNHVTVQTTQEGNGFLVLIDSYFPGWTVKVDGEERPILKANYYYRAVQLGPGKHTLEFDFVPEGMKTGVMVSGFSFFLVVFGGLFLRKPMKKFFWNEKDVVS